MLDIKRIYFLMIRLYTYISYLLINKLHIIPNFKMMYFFVVFSMKLTQQDKARLLNIDPRTLRNWRKDKPYLYKIIMLGFGAEEIINQSDKSNEEFRELVEQLNS